MDIPIGLVDCVQGPAEVKFQLLLLQNASVS